MKSLYLAAPWDMREQAKEVRTLFQQAGWTVTSNWLDWPNDHEPTDDELQHEAIADLADIASSDLLVVLNWQARGEETSGKAVETGYALAKGIPVIIVGERSNVFHFLPYVTVVATLKDALLAANRVVAQQLISDFRYTHSGATL